MGFPRSLHAHRVPAIRVNSLCSDRNTAVGHTATIRVFQPPPTHQQAPGERKRGKGAPSMTFEDSMMQNVPSSIPISGGLRGMGDLPQQPPQLHHNSNRPRRPRSRRDKDKRFTCDVPGCEKTYTRAEHLTRHQLNRKSPVSRPCVRLSVLMFRCRGLQVRLPGGTRLWKTFCPRRPSHAA